MSSYRRFLCDVRVMRGADANSDRHLVLARVKLKLCRANRERRYTEEGIL